MLLPIRVGSMVHLNQGRENPCVPAVCFDNTDDALSVTVLAFGMVGKGVGPIAHKADPLSGIIILGSTPDVTWHRMEECPWAR